MNCIPISSMSFGAGGNFLHSHGNCELHRKESHLQITCSLGGHIKRAVSHQVEHPYQETPL